MNLRSNFRKLIMKPLFFMLLLLFSSITALAQEEPAAPLLPSGLPELPNYTSGSSELPPFTRYPPIPVRFP